MKTIKILAVAVLMAVIAQGVKAQQTRQLTADKHNEYGLVYTLPNTSLRIDVDVRRVVRKAGPFVQYAKKYLGTRNVVDSDAEVWTIETVRVTPFGVADPDRRYLMQLKPNSKTSMTVAADNMLLSINAEAPDYREIPEAERPLAMVTGGGDVEEYLQYMGEEFMAATSLAKKAQILAENLAEVRDSRNALTRGTADNMPSDGRQLNLMLQNLQHQEECMRRAFSGVETVWEQTLSYYHTPGEEGTSTIFRMSDFAGPVESDNYAGSPVELTLNVTDSVELPVDAKGEVKKLPKDAVIYCIPGTASVRITHEGRVLYNNQDMHFAQYGAEFGLDPGIFTDRKDPAYVIFDPATGGIVRKGSVRDLENEVVSAATRSIATQSVVDTYDGGTDAEESVFTEVTEMSENPETGGEIRMKSEGEGNSEVGNSVFE